MHINEWITDMFISSTKSTPVLNSYPESHRIHYEFQDKRLWTKVLHLTVFVTNTETLSQKVHLAYLATKFVTVTCNSTSSDFLLKKNKHFEKSCFGFFKISICKLNIVEHCKIDKIFTQRWIDKLENCKVRIRSVLDLLSGITATYIVRLLQNSTSRFLWKHSHTLPPPIHPLFLDNLFKIYCANSLFIHHQYF